MNSYMYEGRPPRAQNPEIAVPAPPAGENEMVMPTNGRRIFTEGTFELSIDGHGPQCRPPFRGQLAAARPRFPVLGPPAAYVYSLCIPLHLSMIFHVFQVFSGMFGIFRYFIVLRLSRKRFFADNLKRKHSRASEVCSVPYYKSLVAVILHSLW